MESDKSDIDYASPRTPSSGGPLDREIVLIVAWMLLVVMVFGLVFLYVWLFHGWLD